jgi:hypothetical protein
MRDQLRVVVREQRPVPAQELQQVRHLLELGRHVRPVAAQMRVVELQVDHVLDRARPARARQRAQTSGHRQRGRGIRDRCRRGRRGADRLWSRVALVRCRADGGCTTDGRRGRNHERGQEPSGDHLPTPQGF